jgi:hypothetical protein
MRSPSSYTYQTPRQVFWFMEVYLTSFDWRPYLNSWLNTRLFAKWGKTTNERRR